MIDIGVNLLHPQFDPDREAVLERAWAVGVEAMVLTGTDLDSSAAAARFCADRPDAPLWSTAGVHPHDAGTLDGDWLDRLATLAAAPSVRALGETGLDYFRNFSPRQAQRAAFAGQLDLAVELGLPVFVHDRDSDGEVWELLAARREHLRAVVVHCFTGDRDTAWRYLDAGFLLGITGWVCDPRRGAGLRETLAQLPLDRLMIETDAPFLRPATIPPDPRRPRRRNEPAYLPAVADAVAEALGRSVADVRAATRQRAIEFFDLPGFAS